MTSELYAPVREARGVAGLINDEVIDYWAKFQMSTMARILLSWVPMVEMLARNETPFTTVGSFGSGSCTHETTMAMIWPQAHFYAYDETDKYVPKRTTDAWDDLSNMHFTIFDFSGRPKRTFDLVFSIQTLEHIDDMESALEDLIRATAPGGHIYIDTPLYHEDDERQPNLEQHMENAWEKHFHYHLGFSRKKMIERLEGHGLEIVDSGYYCYLDGDQAALDFERTITNETREMVNELTGPQMVRLYERLLRGSERAHAHRFDEIDDLLLEHRPCSAIRVLARKPGEVKPSMRERIGRLRRSARSETARGD